MNLDPNDFELIPHVAVVDEFRMADSSGGMVTLVDAKFLALVCARMNERELKTGDLSPIVIGHTDDETGEVDQPQLVGYARNWQCDPFFDTGRQAAFADFWLYKTVDLVIGGQKVTMTAKEVAKRWPRRSAEVWTDRHEIDPISLLGATTPARDLGLLKLSRGGSFQYVSPGETQVPTPVPGQSPDVAAAAAGQSAPMEKLQAQIDSLTAMVQKLVDAQAAPPVDAAPPGAPPDAGAGQITDDELAQLLGAGGGAGGAPKEPDEDDEQSRAAAKPPVQNAGAGYPGGSNTMIPEPQVKLSALEQELAATKVQLNRLQLSRQLEKVRAQGYDIDPEDAELISDLAAQPEDMRARSLQRIVKLAKKTPTTNSFNMESAINASTNGTSKRVTTNDEQTAVIKLAREKMIKYEDAARELGFSI